jgi:hypothetical protein
VLALAGSTAIVSVAAATIAAIDRADRAHLFIEFLLLRK